MSKKWVDEEGLKDDGSYPLSASQIKSHAKCGEQYRFRYHDDREPTKASRGYLSLGSAVHEAIESVLLKSPSLYQDTLERKFKKAYHNGDEQPPDDMYDDGLDYLSVAARFLESESPNIKGVEERFQYGLGRTDIDSRFRGIIDVTTEDPYEVWDWKTGRIRDDTPTEERIQGGVYLKGFQDIFGRPPDKVRFIYLKEEKQRVLESSDEVWDDMLDYARSLIQSQNNEDFQANPGDICFWCGYESYCQFSDVGVGSVDYEKF